MEAGVRRRFIWRCIAPAIMESHLTDITRVIQLAIAPVFLLTAIGTLIAVLNVRLGRNVDRRRVLEEDLRGTADNKQTDEQRVHQRETRLLTRRIRLIYFAMLSAGFGALLVCLVVAGYILAAAANPEVSIWPVVVGGILAAVVTPIVFFPLIGCLGMFLREVYLAVTTGGHKIS